MRYGFTELDKNGLKNISWAHNQLGIGEYDSLDDTITVYFDPDTGKTYGNGGRGTTTNPFSDLNDFLNLCEQYNCKLLDKELVLDGQDKDYQLSSNIKIKNFDGAFALQISHFKFYKNYDGENIIYLEKNNCNFIIDHNIFQDNTTSGTNANVIKIEATPTEIWIWANTISRIDGSYLKFYSFVWVIHKSNVIMSYNISQDDGTNRACLYYVYVAHTANVLIHYDNNVICDYICSANRSGRVVIGDNPPSFDVAKYIKSDGGMVVESSGEPIIDYNSVMSKTFYVDAVNGDDTTGDGSEDHPFKTIKKAVDSVPSGGRVDILLTPGQIYSLDQYINVINKRINIQPKNWSLVTQESDYPIIEQGCYVSDGYNWPYSFICIGSTHVFFSKIHIKTFVKLDNTLPTTIWEGIIKRQDQTKSIIGITTSVIDINDGSFIHIAAGTQLVSEIALYNSKVNFLGSGWFVSNERYEEIDLKTSSTSWLDSNGNPVGLDRIIRYIYIDPNTQRIVNVHNWSTYPHNPSLTDSEYKQLTLKNMTYMNKVLGVGEYDASANTLTVYFDPVGSTYSNGGRGTTANPFSDLNDFLGLCDEYNCKVLDKILYLDGQDKEWNITAGYFIGGFRSINNSSFWIKRFKFNAQSGFSSDYILNFNNIYSFLGITLITLSNYNSGDIIYGIQMNNVMSSWLGYNTFKRENSSYGKFTYAMKFTRGRSQIYQTSTNDNGTDRAADYLIFAADQSHVMNQTNPNAYPYYNMKIIEFGIIGYEGTQNYDTALYTKASAGMIVDANGQVQP